MIQPRRTVVDRLAVWTLAPVLAGSLIASPVQAQSLLNAPLPVIGDGASPRRLAAAPIPPADSQAAEVLVPLPPQRPAQLGGRDRKLSGTNPLVAEEDCLTELRARGAQFDTIESPKTGNAACRVETPIRLAALSARDGATVPLSLPDKPIVACRLALAFDAWTMAVAPGLAASRGAPLVRVTTGPGWECRTRNRQPGAPLSNHANGLALDVNTFGFANRAHLSVSGNAGDPVFRAVRGAACTFFSTVLGPGSDGFHESHLHVDVVRRGSGRFGKFCH